MMKHFTEFSLDVDDINRYEKSKRKKKETCYQYESDDILTFDIEVTSAWLDEDGKIWNYEKNRSEKFWNNMKCLSLCYIWQFSYNHAVYYGRELKDFLYILDRLDRDTHFIIYVHNLSYEFQFLRNILQFKDIFAREAHKVMYCIPEFYENVEFRCSLFLTRVSLKDWGEELKNIKKLDTLDYTSKIRTPKTKLSQLELDYCEHDCLVVYEGIKTYVEKYEHVVNIPLTQTGEVRRELKRKITRNRSLQRQLISLIPDAIMYRKAKQAFAGGYTHANFTLANRVIETSSGKHYDFASSYPFVMLSEKFPCTIFEECDEIEDPENYAYLIRIRVNRLDARTYNHYISSSKCFECDTDFSSNSKIEIVDNLYEDNGRVISNEYEDENGNACYQKFDMYITEQDLDIIEKTYDIDYEIVECYESKKQYLPYEICEYILELYKNKTELKQKESDKDFSQVEYVKYCTSKKFINSIFGMSCTDIVQDDVDFDGIDWITHEKTLENVETELEELIADNKNRTFMNFFWGVWITAYARHNLWHCVLQGDDGEDNNSIIYCDTDSIFCRDDIDFSDYNKRCRVKLQKMCDYHNFDIEMTEPRDKKGVKHPLGIFAEESDWSQFVTLGAKRYCVRENSDNKLHLTVSGINKEAVEVLHDDITNFNEDLVFDKDDDCVHKMLIKYVENQECVVFNENEYDEYECIDSYGINMRNTSYSMSMTDEYFELTNAANVISHLACLS